MCRVKKKKCLCVTRMFNCTAISKNKTEVMDRGRVERWAGREWDVTEGRYGAPQHLVWLTGAKDPISAHLQVRACVRACVRVCVCVCVSEVMVRECVRERDRERREGVRCERGACERE